MRTNARGALARARSSPSRRRSSTSSATVPGDVHERGRERDPPGPEAVERPRRAAAFRPRLPSATAGRDPGRLQAEEGAVRASASSPLKVEARPRRRRARRRPPASGPGANVAPLVEQADDRLGEHGRRARSRARAGTRSGAARCRPCAGSRRRSPRAAQRARATGRAPVATATENIPAGACRCGRPCRSRSARARGRSGATAKIESMTSVEVDQPEAERDRHHQHEDAAHGRVAPVEHQLQAPVALAQPRHRQQHLDHRRRSGSRSRRRRACASIVSRVRDAEHEAEDDREVPEDRRQRRDGEVVVAVEDPDDDPGDAEQRDDREEHAREPDRELLVAAGSPKTARSRSGAITMKSAVSAPRPSSISQKSVDATRQARLRLALLQQLAEDGDERRTRARRPRRARGRGSAPGRRP